jgi:hypothetical protein
MTTRCYNPQDEDLNPNRRKDLRPRFIIFEDKNKKRYFDKRIKLISKM